MDEKGIDTQTGKVLVEVDPKYFRPAEVEQLLGDPTKAKTLLGWNPRQTSFEELVRIMAEHDMKFVKKLYLRSKELCMNYFFPITLSIISAIAPSPVTLQSEKT